MATYRYQAISKDGKPVSGLTEAYSEFEAIEKIKESCRVVTKISQVNQRELLWAQRSGKVKEKTLAVMCSQFATIIDAGLPLVRAVELIAEQTTDRHLQSILHQVAQDVAGGHSLAESFEHKGKGLPITFIETIRAGETTGTLQQSFEKLHGYFDKSAKLRGKVVSAMTYPALVCIVAVIVVVIIMAFAVPMFVTMFSGMDNLPLPTRILIGVSSFVSRFFPLIIIALAGLIFALKLYGRTEKGRVRYAKIRLKLPVLGKIALMNGASQFANTMSTMLSSGILMTRAVDITGKVMNNYVLGLSVRSMVGGIEEGHRVGDCMRALPYFPPLLKEMTAVGEETGSMEATLGTVAQYYDNEVEMLTSRALSLLEPIITCFIAVFVVLLLLSVYLPMFTMYGSI